MNHIQKQYIYLFAIGFLIVIVESQIIQEIGEFVIIEELNCVFYRLRQQQNQFVFKFFVTNDNYDGNDGQKWIDQNQDLPVEEPKYYIDNNQVYISFYRYNGSQQISFDLRVDFNQIRDDFVGANCPDIGCMKKFGQYCYYFCGNSYMIQDTDCSNLKYQTKTEQMNCFMGNQDYINIQNHLAYKSYFINLTSESNRCLFYLIDKQFDLFAYLDNSNTYIICQLDVNSSNFQCLKQIRTNVNSSDGIFVSKVVQSNGANIFVYAKFDDKTYTFYDFSTFTVFNDFNFI
ncbi:transmembrane protein, putative (macronuclear) [Tetrahymena thermophila SB210]|uniref:Transmembrane protein, putative n=1 Tax=Tetrahymena thermophila (strain SB210) TaxID=312017 RepID=I7LTN3_TETTS|nr:transmembrane protein, putative [Tetrahymena thermophila SB210]EAR85558.3 transmembrane protein, putative [Tetrahymena thermophila SB210]|eukprot:XP_001033221.3 transmembrane protein, putative [Tetrahymena thermophila SB210]